MIDCPRVAPFVFGFANADDGELMETNRFRVAEPKYGNTLELAGETLGTVRKRNLGDDEDQDSRGLQPSIAVVEENKLQSLIAVWSQLHVVRRIEV